MSRLGASIIERGITCLVRRRARRAAAESRSDSWLFQRVSRMAAEAAGDRFQVAARYAGLDPHELMSTEALDALLDQSRQAGRYEAFVAVLRLVDQEAAERFEARMRGKR